MTAQWTDPPAFRIESFLLRPPGLTLVSPRTDAGGHDHIARVQIVGELDIATAPDVSAALVDVARGYALRASWAAPPAIELDLSGLVFLGSGGLTALIDSRLVLQGMGCGLCLSSPRPAVLRLLECAVRQGWLAPDVECASHPWPPVSRPIRVRAGTPLRTPAGS